MGASHNKVYATNADEPPALHKPPTATGSRRASTSVGRTSPWDWLRRPRRSFQRGVVRPLQRRYKKLSWTTRQTVSVGVALYAAGYIAVSVPLRIGFFYDPIHATRVTHWDGALTVFSAMDIVCDLIGVYAFLDFYTTWRDAFSQLSQSVSFELGKKMSKKMHNHMEKPKISTRNRQTASVQRSSQAQWTLATIAPVAVAAAQSSAAVQRQKNIEIVLELIALVPVELVVLATSQYNLLHILRLTKLCRLYRVSECLDKISRIYGQKRWIQSLSLTGISTLARNIALGVVMTHFFACGYMWIAHRTCGVELELCDVTVESSWVIRDRLMGASVTRKYGRALYWASRTIVLLGYDDVTPVSDGETIYGLFVQMCGALLSSSLVAIYLFIFRHRIARQAAFNTHVDNTREYMKSQNMPRELRRKVMSYFSYAWNTHHSLDGEEALHLLPKHLESKIVYTLKASRIKQVCFLMKESVEFINLLALALVHRVYIPNDSIIEPKINAKMFFVIRGTVVLSAFDGSSPKECQTGDFFADCCLLAPEKYEETAMAKTFCELYVLEKAAFDEAIAHSYRGREVEAIGRMKETLEKYSTQLRKTKKLLGLRGGEGSADAGGGGGTKNSGSAGKSRVNRWRLPASTFRIRWDMIRLLAIIYIAFEVPYYIVFISNHDAQRNFVVSQDIGARYVVTLCSEVFFFFDFVLRCRFFAYLDPIVMINVVDPAMIFSAYKSNGFYADLLALLPIALVMESLQGVAEDYSWIFRIFRLVRMRYVTELLQDLAEYYSLSSKVQLILMLLLGVTLILHMVACLWFEMAWVPLTWGMPLHDNAALESVSRQDCLQMATLYSNCSWVRFDCYGQIGEKFPFEDPDSPYKTTFAYVRSMYWAVVALTGVGYGDIVAFSTAESYFAALWVYIGGILNFGVVGAMSSTISSLLAPQHHHVEKLNTLNSMMEHMSISEKLRAEIRRFYHHQFKTRKKAYESQLLTHLPDQLCYQISSMLHSEATKRVPLFDSASREFLEEVTGKFRHRTYQNGETLYIEGDVCKEFLSLAHGRVNMFLQSRGACPVGALHDGDCYGVNEFLLARPHPVTLIATSAVHASVMTREHFDVITRKFADEIADISAEAYDAWEEDKARLKRIAKNLDRMKLKPLVISTPSLFYQKDQHQVTTHDEQRSESRRRLNLGGMTSVSSRRDAEALRSRITGVWNCVLTFLNIYCASTIIFRITFHTRIHATADQTRSFIILDLLCDVFYAFDIWLKLYYFECEEVGLENLITRETVDTAYRSSRQFKRDLVASLPLYYITERTLFATSICRLPRLLRAFDLWTYLDEAIILVQQTFAAKNVSSFLSPIKLLFFLLLGSHYAACIFFWISEQECAHHPTHCWMAHDHILHQYHESILVLYIRSFYWALTTLALVGSREVVPRNIEGTMWAIVTCLGCTFIMGYIIGELSELILDMGKEAKEYKQRVDSFERFATDHGLSDTLRSRVELFFKVQTGHAHNQELDEAVHDLSANLKLKLMHEIYGSAIATLPISRFLTSAQVNNLALRLKTELFIPGDDIVVEDSFGSRLCVMRKGLAAVLWSASVTSVAVLMQGCLFGEVAFFIPKQQRIATVKATTSCEVLHITKHAWNELWSGTSSGSDESHVQRYALHSILDWVKGRMMCYQESVLNIAKRTNRHIMERKIMENLKGMTAPTANKGHKSHVHKLDHSRSFLTPETIVLEKKATYLLSRADKYTKQFEHLLGQQHGAGANSTRSTMSGNFDRNGAGPHHPNHPIGVAASGGPHAKKHHAKKTLKTVDLNFGQFFLEVNPVNKHVAPHLDDHHLKMLEDECWRRFRYMATLQHAVGNMMEALMPHHRAHHHHAAASTESTQPQAPAVKTDPTLQHTHGDILISHLSLQDSRKLSTDDAFLSTRRHRLATGALQAPPTDKDERRLLSTVHASPPSDYPTKRMETQQSGRFLLTRAISLNASTETSVAVDVQRVTRLRRMKRCNSLPLFNDQYFERVKEREEATHRARRGASGGMESTLLGNVGITFDILQKSRRPKLSALYQLYRRYKRWQGSMSSARSSMDSGGSMQNMKAVTRPKRMSVTQTIASMWPGKQSHRNSSIRWQRAQLPNQHAKSVHSDVNALAFQELIKKCSKTWDLVVMFIALYHAIVAPLKVCFRHDLEESHGLKYWSAFEYFLDFLCVVDIGHRIQHAKTQLEQSGKVPHGNSHHHHAKKTLFSISRFVPHSLYDGFVLDVVAVFPLEIFAIAWTGPSKWGHLPYGGKWVYLSFFRLNHVLMVRRLEDLSESVLQYLIYHLKVQIAEAMLYFVRSIGKFLLMAHWIACMFFAISEKASEEYELSWISYAGMLVFKVDATTASLSSHSSTTTSSHRSLSSTSTSTSTSPTTTSSFDLHSVSLTRKYLRSLHFALCSITTLWYGDISSLNLLELFAEFAVILWSTYIYGSLVGAQGELLVAHSMKKATFEQTLTELQHYLVQNNVPKTLKKQIKQYYASIWRRRNGEDEFEAIEGISRALHEDVVYMTLHRFAWKVPIFHSMDVHFLRALLVRLQYVVCSENEEVVIRGDVDRSMYFISDGRILVKMDKSETTKEKGDFFGELALLYGIPRGETCIALTASELYRLDGAPYEELLLEYPEYRAKNRAEWTTAEPPPSQLTTLLHTLTLQAAVQTLTVNAADGERGGGAITTSAILDEETARSYVFKSTMELLAQLHEVDSLHAKHIIACAKRGARKQLKRVAGIETARVDESMDGDEDAGRYATEEFSFNRRASGLGGKKRSVLKMRRPSTAGPNDVLQFSPRTSSAAGVSNGSPTADKTVEDRQKAEAVHPSLPHAMTAVNRIAGRTDSHVQQLKRNLSMPPEV